ncbi:MAG: MipA/OmpV family protein [Allosphingosinicella sp.]
MIRPISAAAAGVLLAAAAPAIAQSGGTGHAVTVGMGAQFFPHYPGDDRIIAAPMPVLTIRRIGQRIPFEAPDEGMGIGLLGDRSAFDFGPALQLQPKRRPKDVGAAVDPVGFTVEAGAFVQTYVGEHFRLRAEGRKGIGGHGAWVGDLMADLVVRDADRTIFSIGPRLRLADRKYARAYFGVSPAVAVRTGLAAFDPDGGVTAAGIAAGLVHQFSHAWGMTAKLGYDRLKGDAARSPVVRRYGSRDQFSGGLALTYTFDVH